MNSSNIKKIVICCCIIIVTSLLFYSPIYLTDLVTTTQVKNFQVQFPVIRFLIEPIYAFMFYALTLERPFYKPALISWILWILLFVISYCKIYKKTLKQSLINIFYALIFFATILLFTAIFPVPGPKLNKPDGYIAVDLHSHSRSSHDNVSTEYFSSKFHKWAGYDSYFITEHQNTNSFTLFEQGLRYKDVFPGMQMATRDGVSVLLLSAKEFDGKEYRRLSVEEIIIKAHENNMFVIMPHWWKWHKFTFEELKNLGIDGFEIYNCGYRNFNEKEQLELIEFSKKNNLIMIGSTDWHGWGYMTDVWTVFKGDNQTNLLDQLAQKPEIQVIVYRQKQSGSIVRFIFEPFAAYYYYIKNASGLGVFSFIVWFVAVFLILKSKAAKYIKKFLPLVFSSIFAVFVVYYYVLHIPVKQTNHIILATMIPILLGFFILWLVVWRLNGKDI